MVTAHPTPCKVNLCGQVPSTIDSVPQESIQYAFKARRRSYCGATKLNPSISNYPSREVDHHDCQWPWSINVTSQLGPSSLTRNHEHPASEYNRAQTHRHQLKLYTNAKVSSTPISYPSLSLSNSYIKPLKMLTKHHIEIQGFSASSGLSAKFATGQ